MYVLIDPLWVAGRKTLGDLMAGAEILYHISLHFDQMILINATSFSNVGLETGGG